MTDGDGRIEEPDEGTAASAASPNDVERSSAKSSGKRRPRPEDDDWNDWDDDDDWDRGESKPLDVRIIAIAVVAVLAIVAVIIFTRGKDEPNGEGNNTGFGCGDWVGEFGGNGSAVSKAGGADGVFVWSGFDGVNIRAIGNYTVKVNANSSFKINPLESGKTASKGVTESAKEGSEITFTFTGADGAGDSPTLNVSCEVTSISFEVTDEKGQPVDPAQIHIGDSDVATSNPAELTRSPAK